MKEALGLELKFTILSFVLVCLAVVTKCYKPLCLYKQSGLSTTETYFSQFWRLEVQDQGASVFWFIDGI
jgi:hypothetical protein